MRDMLGWWTLETYWQLESKLMFLPLFASGYSLSPEQIGQMPLDKILWHARRVEELRQRDAAAFSGDRGGAPPTTPQTSGSDDE